MTTIKQDHTSNVFSRVLATKWVPVDANSVILNAMIVSKPSTQARHQWLLPVILAIQEAEIRRIEVQSQPRKIVWETYLENTHHKKGLVEWLKVKSLSTTKKNKKTSTQKWG
jgi:hypothetical protein